MFAAPLPRPVTRSIMTSSPDITFHDGRSIPQLGYGVWQVENDVAADVVTQAVEAGFRHIDTARGYNNEEGWGAPRSSSASGGATRSSPPKAPTRTRATTTPSAPSTAPRPT